MFRLATISVRFSALLDVLLSKVYVEFFISQLRFPYGYAESPWLVLSPQ